MGYGDIGLFHQNQRTGIQAQVIQEDPKDLDPLLVIELTLVEELCLDCERGKIETLEIFFLEKMKYS
mgnify:CR=1 FL=1